MEDISVNITKLEEAFFDKTSITAGKPIFVLIMGGVGAGKTTLRQHKYNKGYVIIDGGEIFRRIVDKPVDDIQPHLPIIDLAGSHITHRALGEHRNIVMEVIGDDEADMTSIIDTINNLGYHVQLDYVELDPSEAYKRHLKAVKEDPRYLSCYFTKDLHRKWVLEAQQNNS